MARTVAQIKQEMIDQKNSESGLSGLTSTSYTAIWNLIFYICAVAIKVIEDLQDILEVDIETRKLEIPTGVLKWYASESLVFQYGDSLIFSDTYVDENNVTITLEGKTVIYPIIDLDKRIVELAAADDNEGLITIKVAKITSGIAEPLTAPELAAFEDYWKAKRFAGTPITYISDNPDLLKAEYTVTYNPELLNSSGVLISDGVTKPVEVAINDFLQTFQSENFNGAMQIVKLTNAILSSTGVVNVVATNIEAKPDGGSYSDILGSATQTYNSIAGYMKIDPAFPLSTTITYIAE
ncbi:MAG: hypothetical protein OEV44_00285 [Spirochaetota bacterium]|nr:hypothetical protein [Spirochaetota bacterium]